ncbi:amino acid--tRNA ligase-related protein [Nocardia lijiangensis]|uniref:amino acid--tRNA ligase-related protein n=1 Tax=Nocardia lijiangensis TaxID=299618 RepID=UPI0012DBDB15|nr:amino acid--tRNA ligase-related protein [Nocardia lijiangensis]
MKSAADATPAELPTCSHDEFSPLTEVVIGVAADARIPDPMDRSAWLNLYPDLSPTELAAVRAGAFPARMLSETTEDLDTLAQLLSGLGVRVHRPAPIDHAAEFATPHWRSTGFYSYCPRDLALIVGSTILATPSPMRARAHELSGLRGLFQAKMLAGSTWLSAPVPQLADELYPLDADGRPTLGDTEPAFEAANVLRDGQNLYYLVSGSGNELGLRWLQTTLDALGGGHRVHPIHGVYAGTHLDSTISLIREDLVLVNPARITDLDQLPFPLRDRELLWCPPMAPTAVTAPHPLSSEWIGMNLLMVRPDLAIVDASQRNLIGALERRGVGVIPHTLRHSRALGGGIHCVTLDLRRTASPPAASGDSGTAGIEVPGQSLAERFVRLRVDPAARSGLEARSRVVQALRSTLHDCGHVEVDTPLLQRARPAPGRSFRTLTDAVGPHLYLRSSPLHLRAAVTVWPRVFEIGRSFRDEPADATHAPEYSLVELYQVEADYHSLRALAHELITTAARAALGTTVIRISDGTEVDLAAEWTVRPFYTALTAAVGQSITTDTPACVLRDVAHRCAVPVRTGADADEIALELYDRLVEPTVVTPTLHVDFPAGHSPLAHTHPRNPRLAQKWDLVIGGREIATAYTELDDAVELRRRLAPDGDRILPSEAATLDDDWLEVFGSGMPPAGGLCIGLERLLLTLTGSADLAAIIPFPLPRT